MQGKETINFLFVCASLMENAITNDKTEYKQLAKMQFNKVITDVKKLNTIVNKILTPEQVEAFDVASEIILQEIDKKLKST